MDTMILVGKIVAPQGVRGDVRVQTYSETPMDFQNFEVQSAKFKGNDFRFVRAVPDSNLIIAHIVGVDDRNTAESLRGTELFVRRDSLLDNLAENEYYQADLIGFSVIRDSKKIGTVAGFQNFGAGDIIELDNGEMVSFNTATVDLENKEIKL